MKLKLTLFTLLLTLSFNLFANDGVRFTVAPVFPVGYQTNTDFYASITVYRGPFCQVWASDDAPIEFRDGDCIAISAPPGTVYSLILSGMGPIPYAIDSTETWTSSGESCVWLHCEWMGLNGIISTFVWFSSVTGEVIKTPDFQP